MRFGRNSESFLFSLHNPSSCCFCPYALCVLFLFFFFFYLFHLLDLVHTWVLVLGLVLGSWFSSVLRRMPQHGIMIDLDCPWSFSFCLLFFFLDFYSFFFWEISFLIFSFSFWSRNLHSRYHCLELNSSWVGIGLYLGILPQRQEMFY